MLTAEASCCTHAGRLDDDVGAAAFGGVPHLRDRIGITRHRQIGAERLGERTLVGAARHPNHRGASRLRELHVQLPGHAETEHHDGLSGENVDLPLRVQARREHLNHGRRAAVDFVGQLEHMASPARPGIRRSPPLASRPISMAVRTQMRLPDPAVKAGAAIELRIDDDPVAGAKRPAARLDDLAGHLVTHDARIADRNRAVEDLVIGAADAAVRDTHQHVAGHPGGPRDVVERELTWGGQHHGLHGATFNSETSKVSGYRSNYLQVSGYRPTHRLPLSCDW